MLLSSVINYLKGPFTKAKELEQLNNMKYLQIHYNLAQERK